MNFINFGGGEIWDAIEEYLEAKMYQTASFPKLLCDVTDPLSIDLAFKSMEDSSMRKYAWVKTDWVIYTAGVSHIQSFGDMDIDKVWEEFKVNTMGGFHLAKACATRGIRNVIFLDSVAGLYGKPNHSGYSASKMALRSLVQSMAMEGMNAYAISPGRVDTQMRERDYPGEDRRTRLDPSAIARVVKEIMDGKHEPGDNVIIRKRGFRTLRRVDKGSPWKDYLNVKPL